MSKEIEVKIPSFGESIVEVTIGEWLVEEGELVTLDQDIVSIETDKTDADLPSPGHGIIAFEVEKGDDLPIGALIAKILPVEATSSDTPSVKQEVLKKEKKAEVQPDDSQTTTASFDVVVLGSGPGGYVAAIACAQYGMKVAIIEKEKTLGGVCLNVGCIPSKAVLNDAKNFSSTQKDVEQGLILLQDGEDIVANPRVVSNFAQVIVKKDANVERVTKSVEYLMKKNKITIFHGFGSFENQHTLKIDNGTSVTFIHAEHTIIATGTKPRIFGNPPIDEKRVMTSNGFLQKHGLSTLPEHLIVIGAGVVGVELGHACQKLGSKVTVIERSDRILPGLDPKQSKETMKMFEKQGMHFELGVMNAEVSVDGDVVTVTSDTHDPIIGDYCLFATGRTPLTDGVGLETLSLSCDERGYIPVDESCRTAVANISAIGDIAYGSHMTGGLGLAHTASEEGKLVAATLNGEKPVINYNTIPSVIYTNPGIATVGRTRTALDKAGIEYIVGSYKVSHLGLSMVTGVTDGNCEIFTDATTGEVYGAYIVSPTAGDMIHSVVAHMEYRGSADDLHMMTFAHPTLSEAIKEAATIAAGKKAIHG